MKNTRRFISAVIALSMVSALAPMSAFADTEIKRDSSNQSGDMTATYDVKAKYCVTIPAGVTLDSENSVTANFEASDVMLESGQKIKVTLNSADHTESGATFHAQTENGDSTATYTISKGETAVAVGDVVAEFTENGEQSLTFSKAEGATYAGKHTETLTFGISVESAVNVTNVRILNNGREVDEFQALSLSVSDTLALTAETEPEGVTVTWSSSDPSVATVDQNGVVRGVGVGDVAITATAGRQTATCRFTVMFG